MVLALRCWLGISSGLLWFTLDSRLGIWFDDGMNVNPYTALFDEYSTALDDYAAAELAASLAADRRAVAVARMADRGLSLAQVGALLNISSRGRVNELVKRGRLCLNPVADSSDDVVSVLEELRGRVRAAATETLAQAEATLSGGRDDLRMRRPDRVMGETDFLALMARAERDRLTRFGAWISPKRGQTPDNLAGALRDVVAGQQNASDDQVLADVWVPLTRTIDAASVIARGNVPNRRRMPGLNLDNIAPSVAAEGWRVADLLADDETARSYVAERIAA